MIKTKKVYPPLIRYCAKVIPLAFDESISYYECICNIANHINNEIIPKVNESNEIVNEVQNEFIELKEYVDDNMLTKDVNDLTYYTLTSDLSNVALSGNYNDLTNKPTIPDVSNFITKDVNNLTNYPLTSSLSSVAFSGDYDDLSDKPTIPTVPTNVSAFTNDSGYITKNVNDLTYYTKTSDLPSVPTKTSDLTNDSNFVTNTDYATSSKGGVIKSNSTYNSSVASTTGTLYCNSNTYDTYLNKNNDVFISKGTLENVITGKGLIDNAVNDLTNYTTTSILTSLLANKENTIISGNNSNGSYLKFDNGILIQWGEKTFGSGGTADDSYALINFPILFVSGSYTLFATPRYINEQNAMTTILTPSPNTTANSNYIYRRISYLPQTDSGQTALYSFAQPFFWCAIGRWK